MSQTKVKTQKIIKVGNSYAVTLDKKFVEQAKWQVNDNVSVGYSVEPTNIQVSSLKSGTKIDQKRILEEKIPKEFRDWVDQTLEEDKDILEALSQA